MCIIPLKYAWIGRVFRVEQTASGRWVAMGRGPGQTPYPLDRIGDADEEEPMQHKLDAWAKRQGLRPVNMPKAPADMDLFGRDQRSEIKGQTF